MTNSALLKANLIIKGVPRNVLASLLGISYHNLGHKINGLADFNQNEMFTIKDVLKLSDKEFLDIFFSPVSTTGEHEELT